MPDYQRILVVSTSVGDVELARVRRDLGPGTVVLTAPTAEAQHVLDVLGVRAEAQAEALLAPVRSPRVDRGHRVDELVRAHALRDRFRDVVVVTDPATATLLLRVLAPDQLFSPGSVTVVGLVRGERPVAARRAVVIGVVLGVISAVPESLALSLALPGAAAAAGLVLLLVAPLRHVGKELLLATGIAVMVALLVIAGSARFPAGF